MEIEKVKATFDACQEEGVDKDSTIMRIAQENGLGITAAIRAYNQFARAAGILLTAKERQEKINEMLLDNEPDLLDTDVRKEYVQIIADEYDISNASAAQHVKTFCENNGIELPTVQRTSLEDMVQFVKDLHEEGKSRADIVQSLQDEIGYTANSAASAYSRATRELGISTGTAGAKADISEVVAFIRSHTDIPKKQAVKKMCEELGYAESTANTFFTYLPMAREYARQEIEALNG